MIRATFITLGAVFAVFALANAHVPQKTEVDHMMDALRASGVMDTAKEFGIDVDAAREGKLPFSPEGLTQMMQNYAGASSGFSGNQMQSMISLFMKMMENPSGDHDVMSVIGDLMHSQNPKMAAFLKDIDMNELENMLQADDVASTLQLFKEKFGHAIGDHGIELADLLSYVAQHMEELTSFKGELFEHIQSVLMNFYMRNAHKNDLLRPENLQKIQTAVMQGLSNNPMGAMTTVTSMIHELGGQFQALIADFFEDKEVAEFLSHWKHNEFKWDRIQAAAENIQKQFFRDEL